MFLTKPPHHFQSEMLDSSNVLIYKQVIGLYISSYWCGSVNKTYICCDYTKRYTEYSYPPVRNIWYHFIYFIISVFVTLQFKDIYKKYLVVDNLCIRYIDIFIILQKRTCLSVRHIVSREKCKRTALTSMVFNGCVIWT